MFSRARAKLLACLSQQQSWIREVFEVLTTGAEAGAMGYISELRRHRDGT